MTAGTFPPEIIAAACASRAKWDIPASICLAQWALESGWGRFMPVGSNNPFGIKAADGQPFVVAMTREVLHGEDVRLPQRFRKFADAGEAFDAHGKLLATGSDYAAARAVRRDAKAFAHALQGHYATDPHYAAELIGVMNASDLGRYDVPSDTGHRSVNWIQSSLNRLGQHPVLAVDGVLGPKTHAAVCAFQAAHGLAADAQANPATVAAIEAALAV